MTHKLYLVTGKRKYRWHDPGSTFEAKLDPEAERRAVERGSIKVLAVIQSDLADGSYELPKDWPHAVADEPSTRAAHGVSQVN